MCALRSMYTTNAPIRSSAAQREDANAIQNYISSNCVVVVTRAVLFLGRSTVTRSPAFRRSTYEKVNAGRRNVKEKADENFSKIFSIKSTGQVGIYCFYSVISKPLYTPGPQQWTRANIEINERFLVGNGEKIRS